MSKKNRRNLTNEEFIERCKKVHGDRFDYSLTKYSGTKNRIKIICKEHGPFEMIAYKHSSKKQGCPKCAKFKTRHMSNEEFIEKAILKHKDTYSYTNTVYKGYDKLVSIICKKHGEFEILAKHFLKGDGCEKCYKEEEELLNTNKFISSAKLIHKDLYDYTQTVYKDSNTKVNIICKKHGKFQQNPYHHLDGHGCNLCRHEKLSALYTKDPEKFIREAQKKHRNKYDYSKTFYKGKDLDIIITCKTHGDFTMKAGNHLHGLQGCPKCHTSQGELLVEEILTENNVVFKRQVKFDECFDKSRLPFDFQVFFNDGHFVLLEIDGEHHRKPVRFNGISSKDAEKLHKANIRRDKIKTDWAEKNNFKLIRLNYFGKESLETLRLELLNLLKDEIECQI